MSVEQVQGAFLRALDPRRSPLRLFEHLPDVFFFIKDREGRFVMANGLFMEKCGVASERELIGRRDEDFFPPDRTQLYVEDDRWVMRTGESIVNRVELAPEADGSANLFVTTKVPVYDRRGRILGIAGIARDLNRAGVQMSPFTQMTRAVDYIGRHYAERIEVRQLAVLAGMSVSQFERKFRQMFKFSPRHYLIHMRITRACKVLAETDATIAAVAQDHGFYDHSHFTRHFERVMGLSPKDYRRRRRGETGTYTKTPKTYKTPPRAAG